MDTARTLAQTAAGLRSSNDLARAGMNARQIRASVAAGDLIRLRPGWYAAGGEAWGSQLPEHRHLSAMLAASRASSGTHVFSHRSAATLHELPVWSDWMRNGRAESSIECMTAHVLSNERGSSTEGPRLRRHRAALAASDVVEIEGMRCTSADRTLYDIAATEPFEVALACADRVLRRQVCIGRVIDEERCLAWRERMLGRAKALRGARGVRALRMLALLADPRAESPLESVSRLRAWQLGLRVELQVPVLGEHGETLYLDFVFSGQGVFGECDGKAKYFDERLTGGRTGERVFEDERRRHNWVSGATGMRGVRWGVTNVTTRERFARRLREFGVKFPGRATTAFGSEIARFLDELQ